jgi:hypothetical protein
MLGARAPICIFVCKKKYSNYVENIRFHRTKFSRTAVAVHCAKKMHVIVNNPTYTVLNVSTDAIMLHFNQETPSNCRVLTKLLVFDGLVYFINRTLRVISYYYSSEPPQVLGY